MAFGGMNMQNLMKQAKAMQEQLEKQNQQAEVTLNEARLVGTSGGGMVEVVINGKKEVVSLKLKPEVVDADDVEMLEDLIISALNDAMAKATELEAKVKPSMPGGMF